jgi:lipoprotein-anchoring transpeptidase ErfK/SrfK
MRNRSIILVATVLVILLAGAAAVYAYDRSGRDVIAKGVRVAGIDVGGLTAAQAHARLDRAYLSHLRQPIVVDHGRARFRLTARESKVAVDVSALVDEALAKGRDESIVDRTWRRLTGGRLAANLTPSTTFDKAASVRLVDRVRKAIDRAPKNADIAYSVGGVSTTPSQVGVAVLASELHAQIDRAIVDPHADHRLVARTRKVEPAVSTDQLAQRYPSILIVNREKFQLSLYTGLKLAKTYSVAIGAVGLDTPAGLYHIQNKAVDPAWTEPNSSWVPEEDRGKVIPGGTPENPLKARWMGIFDGAGIHGVDPSEYGTIGHAASHGCVRMRISDVVELYPHVPVGAPIFIA